MESSVRFRAPYTKMAGTSRSISNGQTVLPLGGWNFLGLSYYDKPERYGYCPASREPV